MADPAHPDHSASDLDTLSGSQKTQLNESRYDATDENTVTVNSIENKSYEQPIYGKLLVTKSTIKQRLSPCL